MKRSALLLAAGVGALGLLQLSASPAQASTQNNYFPIDLFVFIPCANSGAGELVELTGQLHDLFTITSNSNGTFHVKFLDNPQGVSGTGPSGDKYQATGGTQGEFNTKVGYQSTYVNNFRII